MRRPAPIIIAAVLLVAVVGAGCLGSPPTTKPNRADYL